MPDARGIGAAWKRLSKRERDHCFKVYKELVRVKQCQKVNVLLLSKSSFKRAGNTINL